MTVTRRRFLEGLGWLALAPTACTPARQPAAPSTPFAAPAPPSGVVLNDIHSRLNETRVARVVEVSSLDGLHAAVLGARDAGLPISIAGGGHSMGGQQYGEGTVHLDTRGMNRVLGFDRRSGLLKVEAGIQWPELVAWTVARQEGVAEPWGIAQKQTGADRLAIGGALSCNAHGRGLAMRPIIGDVDSFTLIDGNGGFRTCSRSENAELFRLAIGGYGLFGVIYSVRLRLARRRKLRRVVETRAAKGLADAFESRIGEGCLYGDFQLETDESSPTFLRRGILTYYRPVSDETAILAGQVELSDEEWTNFLALGHTDKARAFELYSRFQSSTSGQIYWSDTSQLSFYPDGYHRSLDERLGSAAPGSEMITEVYVPRRELEEFLDEAALALRTARANVIDGTIRLIERDRQGFLAWAKDSYACLVVSLHVDHTPGGIEHAKQSFRLLIDLARRRGGSYFLAYHRWATREQVLDCYPQFPEFLRLKFRYDPQERFQSEWYRHYRSLVA